MHALWDQAVVSVASFAAMAFVGRLGKEQLGIYALGISTFWLVAGIANALVWTPYTARSAHLSQQRRLRYRGASAGFNLAIGVGLGLCSLVLAGAFWLGLPQQMLPGLEVSTPLWLSSFFLACAPLAVALTLREHARRIFIADFQGVRLLAFDVPIAIALVTAMCLLFTTGALNAQLALLTTAAATSPGIYITVRHMWIGRTSWRRIAHVAAANWSYGKWLLVVALAWLASDGLLQWMLVGLKGERAMGAFAGALLIVSLVNPLVLAMRSFARSVASRQLARGTPLELTGRTLNSLRWIAPVAGVAFLLLLLFGNSFMSLVLGRAYADQELVALLALAVCLEAVTVPIEATFIALESGRLLSVVATSRFALSMFLGLILIPGLGALGVAIAMLGRSLLVLAMYACVLWTTHQALRRRARESDEERTTATDDSGRFQFPGQVTIST